MKHTTHALKKWLILGLLIALTLTLTGCYAPPENTTGNGTAGDPVGNNARPFETIAPTASPTPKPTEVPTPTAQVIYVTPAANNNWSPATDNPAAQNTWTPATTRPVMTATPIPNYVDPATANPAFYTAPPTPTSGTLEKGAKGDSVKVLQQRLKDLGYYKGRVDGDFGDGTAEAVKAFQLANGLQVDGKVGSRTSQRLYSTAAVSAREATRTLAPAVTPTPRPTATPRPTSTPRTNLYLSLGTRNKNVTTLQKRLVELGYLSGGATGSYDGATETAVKAFQKRAGLWQDGKAGPDTLSAIYSANAPRASHLAASVGVTLREGDKGDEVRAMQRRLKELGYLSGSVDGSFGPATAAALITFQQVNGLKSDGVAGSNTLDRLYDSNALPASAAEGSGDYLPIITAGPASNAVSPQATPYLPAVVTSVEQGDGSDQETVKALQTRLKELGFYTGPVDGDYGSSTVTAVMNFQMSRNLTVDGKAGQKTLDALYSNSSPRYSTLKQGSRGSSVRNLQYTLYELGYYKASVDGSYGSTTASAVSAFQSRNGLPATGVADADTLDRLYSSAAKPAPTEKNSTYATLRPGDVGEDVLDMKDTLIQLGYMQDDGSNVYNAKTEDAVRTFQSRNGLTPDGVAGPATLKKLYSGNPVAFSEP